jgi:dCTP deaminase
VTVLSRQTIAKVAPLHPFSFGRRVVRGRSAGLSHAGYDICIAQDRMMWPGRFTLASSVERFDMPDDLLGVVHDKSTWIRSGIAVGNTVLEPGWSGFLTLELKSLNQFRPVRIHAGDPIAQVIFHRLDRPTSVPYGPSGKYYDQPARPVPALAEPQFNDEWREFARVAP